MLTRMASSSSRDWIDFDALMAEKRAMLEDRFEVTSMTVPARSVQSLLNLLHGSLLPHFVRVRHGSVMEPLDDERTRAAAVLPGPLKTMLFGPAVGPGPELEGLDALMGERAATVRESLATTIGVPLTSALFGRRTESRGYESMGIDEALRRLLPPDLTLPSAFESAGHIARMNLAEEHWPWRRVIGRVVLDKAGSKPSSSSSSGSVHGLGIRIVVTKTGAIESEFRTLPLEVIAGEGLDSAPGPLPVEIREHGCILRFDYRAVYWNSRLQTEHSRLVDAISSHAGLDEPVDPDSTRDEPRTRVLDMTCGVGPFALPLARRGLWVRANDLNPESVRACEANVRTNRLQRRVVVTCEDARAAVLRATTGSVPGAGTPGEPWPFAHAVANLPDKGMQLLGAWIDGNCRSNSR